MVVAAHFDALEEALSSAVISDVLDDLGYRHQALSPELKPLFGCKLIGRAFTVLAADVYEVPQEPYKLQLEALDAMKKDDIFLVTTGSMRAAFWGELISARTIHKGGRGAIVDGLSRDTEKVREMGFPVFSRGRSPVDSKGRIDVIAYNVPVECGGVSVYPQDLIFGDADGIVVVPQAIEDEVIRLALEKVEQEKVVKTALEDGMGAADAFRKYGVL